jgi:hypothetical protein
MGHGMVQQTEGDPGIGPEPERPDDIASAPQPEMPLGIVIARIVVVSGMSFAAAFAIFFLVGGFFAIAGASALATLVFLFLMFAIERSAERS